MSRESLFWLLVIVLLNLAAYLVGKAEGKNQGYQVTITLLSAVAPEEMKIIKEKMNKIDPWNFAVEYVVKSRMEKVNAAKR